MAINENFIAQIKRREGGNLEITSLLGEYGFNKRHARTGETIISQTSDIAHSIPKIAHNQKSNQQVKSGGFKIDTETKEIYGSAEYKKTAQWESVWYSKGQRRK